MLRPYNNKFWINFSVCTEESYNIAAKSIIHHVVIWYGSVTLLSLDTGDSLISQNVFILLTSVDTVFG